jgi:hypothetical protein
MKLNLNVTMANGDSENVPVKPSTQVAYERHFKTALSNEIGMEQLYWLAWKASGGKPQFDTWLDDLESVAAEVSDESEGDAIDPLG